MKPKRPTRGQAIRAFCVECMGGELRHIPHVRLGGAVLIPIDALRAWLLEQAKAEATIADEAVEDILGSLGGAPREPADRAHPAARRSAVTWPPA